MNNPNLQAVRILLNLPHRAPRQFSLIRPVLLLIVTCALCLLPSVLRRLNNEMHADQAQGIVTEKPLASYPVSEYILHRNTK